MTTIKGIELASDIYDLEDTQGRTATQTAQNTASNALNKAGSNETAIEVIQAVIPSSASSSNPLATQNNLSNLSSEIAEELELKDITITPGSGVTITQVSCKRLLGIAVVSVVVTCDTDRVEGFVLGSFNVHPLAQVQCACSGEGRAAIKADGSLALDSTLVANDSMRCTCAFAIAS